MLVRAESGKSVLVERLTEVFNLKEAVLLPEFKEFFLTLPYELKKKHTFSLHELS